MKLRSFPENLNNSNYTNAKYLIPDLCPRCGVSNNPTTQRQGYRLYSDCYIAFYEHHCPSCNGYHWSLQQIFPDKTAKGTKMLAYYPNSASKKFTDRVNNFSPRFVSMYHQAERADNNGDLDLAGIGYRAATEILIKDYAVKINKEPQEEVAKLTFNNAISHVFKNDNFVSVPADVVRIYGNDYAHWDRPKGFNVKQHLEEIKAYLKILIDVTEERLMIVHPPVDRDHKSNK